VFQLRHRACASSAYFVEKPGVEMILLDRSFVLCVPEQLFGAASLL
jgi:hypothetical protein